MVFYGHWKILDIVKFSVKTHQYKLLGLLEEDRQNYGNKFNDAFENPIHLKDIVYQVITSQKHFIFINITIVNQFFLLFVQKKFDQRLSSRKINSECLTFITDGSSHLRQILIPQCARLNIELPSYYYSYYDIRKEFQKYNLHRNFATINDESLNDILKSNYYAPSDISLRWI